LKKGKGMMEMKDERRIKIREKVGKRRFEDCSGERGMMCFTPTLHLLYVQCKLE